MSNVGYSRSPLEDFLRDLSLATGFPHTLGDYENVRKQAQKPPIVWRHPMDRQILDVMPLRNRKASVDAYKEVEETLEMVVVGADYLGALHLLTEVWRLGFDGRARTHEGSGDRKYRDNIIWGRVRRGREGEIKGVPATSFALIDLVTIQWLLPRQEPLSALTETVSVGGIMTDEFKEEVETTE
jgi:hypothetical protein